MVLSIAKEVIAHTIVKVAIVPEGVVQRAVAPGLLIWNMTGLTGNIFQVDGSVFPEPGLMRFGGVGGITGSINLLYMALFTILGADIVIKIVANHIGSISSLEEVMHCFKIGSWVFFPMVVQLDQVTGTTAHQVSGHMNVISRSFFV